MKRMSRKMVCVALGALLFVLSVSAEAQQAGKIFRVGFLDASTESGNALLMQPLMQELNKLGWMEGKNIAFEYRFAEGQPERQNDLAAEVVRLKLDIIVVAGTGAALAAKRATTTIPIVMASAGDPVAAGLVASLARPGGNVTGFSALATDLNTKRLEVLKDAVPKLSRVGLLIPSKARSVEYMRAAALALKLKLEEIETQIDAKGLESAFQTAKQKAANAIMMTPGTGFFAER